MSTDFKLDNADDLVTDDDLERNGVELDFGGGRTIVVRRAGGRNHRFATVAAAHQKPFQFQIDQGTIDPKVRDELNRKIFADACIVDMQGWSANGQPLPYTKENARLLMSQGGVYDAVVAKATELATFRRARIEADLDDAKNA